MPKFYYKNSLGAQEQIFVMHQSITPGFYICETTQADQLHVHKDCIRMEHSLEDKKAAWDKWLEKQKGKLAVEFPQI